jgi:hypothetical protein
MISMPMWTARRSASVRLWQSKRTSSPPLAARICSQLCSTALLPAIGGRAG